MDHIPIRCVFIYYVYMHIYALCMCRFTYLCRCCACVWSLDSNLRCPSSSNIVLFSETGSLVDLALAKLSRLGGQPA